VAVWWARSAWAWPRGASQTANQALAKQMMARSFAQRTMKWWLPLLLTLGGLPQAQPLRPSEESLRARERFQKALAQGRYRVLPADPRARRIEEIGQRLAAGARRPIPWRFSLVQSSEPNAACCGEGVVFVTTGLLDLSLDDDELAGVLSHEVIHGVRQHVEADYLELARLEKALNEYRSHRRRHANDQSETAEMRERYEYNRLMQQYQQAESYARYKPSFSRSQEREADSMGLKLAVDCGYRADGLMRALEKLLVHHSQRYGQSSILGSKTHPPLPERIKRLQEIQSQSGY